jgi:CheY-like chemotaxis protein
MRADEYRGRGRTKGLTSPWRKAIVTLAAGVAHDLNNILAPILLVSPLLRGDLSPAEKEQFLSLVQASAERGAGVVKQMLTFARGADGERVLVQPIYLLEEVAKVAGQTFPKTIAIQTEYPQDLWVVEGDPTQLQQVLLNLCVNARDAMPNGGTLRLTSENFEVDEHYASMIPGASAGPHVMMKVSDDGVGIQRHVIDKIFDPFFTTKEVGKGTGLGLSTVIGIVKSYGGFINVYSEPGHTSFKVFLPARGAGLAAVDSRETSKLPDGRGQTILVVDDEPTVREAAQTLLRRCGYNVLEAEDGVTALAIFARNTEIDLVLTDMVMPFMDGFTLIRTLRKMNPKTRILVSTGRDESCRSAEMAELGVDACLLKPYTRETLLVTLGEVFREPAVAA